MEDNFENELKKHGDAYKVQPRGWVWPRVEAELDKKTERRIAAWWWMAPMFLLMLGAGYWLIDSKQSNNTVAQTAALANTATEKSNDKQNKQQANKKNDDVAAYGHDSKTVATVANSPKKTAPTAAEPNQGKPTNTEKEKAANTLALGSKKTAKHAAKPITAHTNNASPTVDLSYANTIKTTEEELVANNKKQDSKPIETSERSKTENILASGKQANQTEDLTDILLSNSETERIKTNTTTSDSSNNEMATKAIVPTQTDSTEAIKETAKQNELPNISPKAKQLFNKETVWTINIGAGKTNNKNGLGLSDLFSLEQKMYDSSPQYNSGTGNGGCQSCNANSLPLLSSKPGINLNLSVARSQWISNRWLWQAELGWQYQQMQQRYGGRKDSTVFYSNLSSAAYSYYYQSGSVNTSNGYNHRIFLSNQIVLAMLKNRALRASVGLYGGFNIGNNYLIPDKTNYRFVDGKNLYNKGFIGGEASIKYVLKNNWSIGLNGRVDFSRSFTPPDGNKQYWKSWQLQAGIPVTNIKHLFKK